MVWVMDTQSLLYFTICIYINFNISIIKNFVMVTCIFLKCIISNFVHLKTILCHLYFISACAKLSLSVSF